MRSVKASFSTIRRRVIWPLCHIRALIDQNCRQRLQRVHSTEILQCGERQILRKRLNNMLKRQNFGLGFFSCTKGISWPDLQKAMGKQVTPDFPQLLGGSTPTRRTVPKFLLPEPVHYKLKTTHSIIGRDFLKDESVKTTLLKISAAIDEIATAGDNSLIRRIKSVVIDELKPFSDSGIQFNENSETFDNNDLDNIYAPLRCWLTVDGIQVANRCCHDRLMNEDEALHEFQADDRRKSVFADPNEAALSALVDFYSGRLKSVEIRDAKGSIDFDAMRKSAWEYMKGKYPLVTVNHALASSKDEVVMCLRAMADEIELGSDANELGALANCSRRTEGLGTRWINNGTELQRGTRIVERCCSRDPCCGNETCSETVVGGGWTTVWRENGHSSPPPTNPPVFQRYPWNNRESFFFDSSDGVVTSDWGWRTLSSGSRDFHGGLDIGVSADTRVRSIGGGTIAYIKNEGWDSGIILEKDGKTYTYWHIKVSSNHQIGDLIGNGTYLGDVADGGPAHLHYAVHEPSGGDWESRNDGNSQNPLP